MGLIIFSVVALMISFFLGCASFISVFEDQKQTKKAKNIIIMISDGAGYNTHLATEYWHGAKQPYDNRFFSKYPVATYTCAMAAPMVRHPVITDRIRN